MKPIQSERSGLDEMQRAHRDRIGNQSFFLLFYLLLIDCGLSGFGFRWLSYPANVMVILMVVMGISLIRMIVKNAYVGPKAKKPQTERFLVAAALGMALAAFVLLGDLKTLFARNAGTGDNSALLLFLVSSVILAIALVVSLIRRKQNRDDEKNPKP